MEKKGVLMKNDTLQSIFTRYSCRKFTDRMPSDEDLELLAKAAVAAPSGVNRQLWRVIIVKNKELMADMEAEGLSNLKAMPDQSMYQRIVSRGGYLFYHAPCMMVVATKQADPAGAEMFDCGILAENVCLGATSLGMDSCMLGLAAFCFAGGKREEFRERLGFPADYEIGIGILLGYGAEKGTPHPLDMEKVSVIS
jgi:nitroreductase